MVRIINKILKELGLEIKDLMYLRKNIKILLDNKVKSKGILKILETELDQSQKSISRRHNKIVKTVEDEAKNRYKLDEINGSKLINCIIEEVENIKE